ncbi:MAG: hypothetical protein NC120_06310 [Ruminococcus sp.]|nr:hypothetical protein [Ruminococcus sp.]
MEKEKDFMESIEALESELALCDESIIRTKDEINAKRRYITEQQAKKKNLEAQIKAKRFEFIESLVSDKLDMSIDELAGAVKSGGILIEKENPSAPVTDKKILNRDNSV